MLTVRMLRGLKTILHIKNCFRIHICNLSILLCLPLNIDLISGNDDKFQSENAEEHFNLFTITSSEHLLYDLPTSDSKAHSALPCFVLQLA